MAVNVLSVSADSDYRLKTVVCRTENPGAHQDFFLFIGSVWRTVGCEAQ